MHTATPRALPFPWLPFPTLVLAALAAAGLSSATPAGAQAVPGAVRDGLVSQLETVSGHILSAAEQVPEGQYGYQPTEEVRTFGELVSHVADAHFGYCSAIAGGSPPAAAEMDASTKAEIVRRFRASRDYCLQVYRRVDGATLGESIDVFGSPSTRAWTMIQNVSHDNLHYGNVITYMRSIGMVPPSSQTGG